MPFDANLPRETTIRLEGRYTAGDLREWLGILEADDPAKAARSALQTTRDDLAGLLRRSLVLEDTPACIVNLDAAGQGASALLVRTDDEARKAQVRTAINHIASAKRLIREATR